MGFSGDGFTMAAFVTRAHSGWSAGQADDRLRTSPGAVGCHASSLGGAGPMRTEIEEEISQFLVDEVLEEPEFDELPKDAPLLSGLLDSFALATLIDFIEDRYMVTVDGDEMVKDNFRSVEALAAFIESKQDSSS
jgi:acyl carrier protein